LGGLYKIKKSSFSTAVDCLVHRVPDFKLQFVIIGIVLKSAIRIICWLDSFGFLPFFGCQPVTAGKGFSNVKK